MITKINFPTKHFLTFGRHQILLKGELSSINVLGMTPDWEFLLKFPEDEF